MNRDLFDFDSAHAFLHSGCGGIKTRGHEERGKSGCTTFIRLGLLVFFAFLLYIIFKNIKDRCTNGFSKQFAGPSSFGANNTYPRNGMATHRVLTNNNTNNTNLQVVQPNERQGPCTKCRSVSAREQVNAKMHKLADVQTGQDQSDDRLDYRVPAILPPRDPLAEHEFRSYQPNQGRSTRAYLKACRLGRNKLK